MFILFKIVAMFPRFTAWLVYLIMHRVKHYKVALLTKNIAAFMPELPDRAAFVRGFHREWARNLTEYCMIFAGSSERQARQRVTFTNPELVHNHLASGHRVMLASAHTANLDWVWLANCLEFGGDAMHLIGAPQDGGVLDEMAMRVRARFGGTTVLPNEVKAKLLSGSQTPDLLMYLGDLRPPERLLHQGALVPFLDSQTYMFTSMGYLAHRMAMHIVYMDMQRVGLGRFEVTFTDISHPPSTEDLVRVQRDYVSHIEKAVRKNPSSWWFWSKKIMEKAEPQNSADQHNDPAEHKEEY